MKDVSFRATMRWPVAVRLWFEVLRSGEAKTRERNLERAEAEMLRLATAYETMQDTLRDLRNELHDMQVMIREHQEKEAREYAEAAAAAGQQDLLDGPDPDDPRAMFETYGPAPVS